MRVPSPLSSRCRCLPKRALFQQPNQLSPLFQVVSGGRMPTGCGGALPPDPRPKLDLLRPRLKAFEASSLGGQVQGQEGPTLRPECASDWEPEVVGRQGLHAYCASKHAVAGLTKSMAAELGGSGVCVNCLEPGYIRTDLTRRLQDDPKFNSEIDARTPVGRWGTPR